MKLPQTASARRIWKHQNHYLAGDLEAQIEACVEHANHDRCHESLRCLAPADVCAGRGQSILLGCERIKRQTVQLCFKGADVGDIVH